MRTQKLSQEIQQIVLLEPVKIVRKPKSENPESVTLKRKHSITKIFFFEMYNGTMERNTHYAIGIT